MKIITPSRLSDVALVAEVKRLAVAERVCTAELIGHLAELDRRRLYLAGGFSSSFTYCTGVLGLSESAAYHRLTAARTARRFPRILDMLDDGSLNLTSVQLLSPVLTEDNVEELLTAASHLSKRQVEELVARYAPRPDVPDSIRKLPTMIAPAAVIPVAGPPEAPAAPPDSAVAPTASGGSAETLPPLPASPPVLMPPMPMPRRSVIQALAPDRYEVRFTAREATCDKLRLAQDLLRHAVPSGDTGEIVDRALSALLENLARKKFAAAKRPRPSPGPSARSRYLPAKLRRAVWVRDGGRCRFVGTEGGRCRERGFLEFHHVDPYGVGGEATVDTVELRCRAHNGYEAELFYGPGVTRRRRAVAAGLRARPVQGTELPPEAVPGKPGTAPERQSPARNSHPAG